MDRARRAVFATLVFIPLLTAQSDPGFQQIPGNLKQVSDGAVWGVNGYDEIFAWDSQTSSWTEIPGSLSQIAVGSSSSVWGINAAGAVYRWSGSEWFSGGWDPIILQSQTPGTFTQIAPTADGVAWVIDNAHNMYYIPSQSNLFINEQPGYNAVSAGSDGLAWTITTSGNSKKIGPATLTPFNQTPSQSRPMP